MQNSLQFKISSALKNIIGSDLINDDFIAVFELVKNSYDAHATEVAACFGHTVLRISHQTCQAIDPAGVRLQLRCFLHIIELIDGRESVMFDFKLIMVKRMSAHEHTGHILFIIQQFGQRPRCCFGQLWCGYIHRNHITKQAVGNTLGLRLETVPKLDDDI